MHLAASMSIEQSKISETRAQGGKPTVRRLFVAKRLHLYTARDHAGGLRSMLINNVQLLLFSSRLPNRDRTER